MDYFSSEIFKTSACDCSKKYRTLICAMLFVFFHSFKWSERMRFLLRKLRKLEIGDNLCSQSKSLINDLERNSVSCGICPSSPAQTQGGVHVHASTHYPACCQASVASLSPHGLKLLFLQLTRAQMAACSRFHAELSIMDKQGSHVNTLQQRNTQPPSSIYKHEMT